MFANWQGARRVDLKAPRHLRTQPRGRPIGLLHDHHGQNDVIHFRECHHTGEQVRGVTQTFYFLGQHCFKRQLPGAPKGPEDGSER